jgi:hypothetical protein
MYFNIRFRWAILVSVILTILALGFGANALAENAAGQVLKPQAYSVQWGENLTVIAARFDTTVDEIVAMNRNNPTIRNRDLVLAEGKILLPFRKDVQQLILENIRLKESILQNEGLIDSYSTGESFYQIWLFLSALIIFVSVYLFVTALILKRKLSENLKEAVADAGKERNEKEEVRRKSQENIARTRKELSEANCRIFELEELMRGATSAHVVQLQTKEEGVIPFRVDTVQCLQCETSIKLNNALSHYFKNHSTNKE